MTIKNSPVAASALGEAVRWIALLVALCAAALTPTSGYAADDALKDLLGRAQSQAEKKAVEDLIDKLKGPAAPPASAPAPASIPVVPSPPPAITTRAPELAPPAPTKDAVSTAPAQPPSEPVIVAPSPPPAPPAQVAAPSPRAEPAPAATPPAPTEPAKVATPAPPPVPDPPAAAAPAPVTPEAAVASAERNELPSVDVEVFFEYASAEILPQAHAALMTLGRALADTRLADRAFLIAGHTDAKGGNEYNLKLSQSRADAVRHFLIATFAIDAKKLTAKGFGKLRLKNSDRPLAGENRRVQIVSYSTRDTR